MFHKNIIISFLFLMPFITLQARDAKLREASLLVSPEQPFRIFDANFSKEEIEILQNVKVESFDKNLFNHGKLDQLEFQVCDFLKSLGNDDQIAEQASQIINKTVLQSVPEGKTAYVILSACQSTDHFNEPAWHTDGDFGIPTSEHPYRIAYVLQGPGTLFSTMPQTMRSEYINIDENNSYNGRKLRRERLIALLQDYKVDSPQVGQGAIFLVGDNQAGAIHSVPKIDRNRLFLSIVPLTQQQAEDLRQD